MKNSLFVSLLVFFTSSLLAQDFEIIDSFDLPPLEIRCTITSENSDKNLYEISWKSNYIDSIAASKGELPYMELHCFVYDSKGLVGYYKGLSTPLRHCSFTTRDTLVKAFFRLRRMKFNPNDSSNFVISTLYNHSLTSTPHRGHEYESVLLSTNSTSNKKITLTNDENTVLIKYGDHPRLDGIGYPTIIGFAVGIVISLDRFYLNRKTGRIRTGKSWIDKKGIKKMVIDHNQYLLVYPFKKYIDKEQHEFLGYELIEQGKIKLKEFRIKDFTNSDLENYAY
jgi:hypothetical protein